MKKISFRIFHLFFHVEPIPCLLYDDCRDTLYKEEAFSLYLLYYCFVECAMLKVWYKNYVGPGVLTGRLKDRSENR